MTDHAMTHLAAPLAGTAVQTIDWVALAPPTIVAVTALVVLVADLFLPPGRKAVLGTLTIAGLLAATAFLYPLRDGDRDSFCLRGNTDVCSYTADRFALTVQLLVLGGALLTALMSMSTVRDSQSKDAENGRLPAGEYWFLLLCSASGAALLPASRDLATLLVALEVASLPAFALVALKRGERRSAESALKFFLSSVTATAVTLLGISFVYAATGSLFLTEIARESGEAGLQGHGQFATLMQAGVVLTLVGFAFKTAAAPFHFWVPETYVGAPLPVAAYLSVVGKAVGFSGLILLAVIAFPSYGKDLWGPALAALAALTMTVGNLGALRQRAGRALGAVRLLAWSSIGQAGYLLVPVAAAAWSGNGRRAVGATLAYALMYAVVNLGAFAVVALVTRSRPAGRLSDFRGLFASRPVTALLLAFFLLCLAGLPPGIVGLFAKVTVFAAAVDAGLAWLAVVMAVNVVIALVYYLKWTAELFRGAAGAGNAEQTRPAEGAEVAEKPGTTAEERAGAAGVGETSAEAPRARLTGVPAPLALVLVLTAVAALALSGAPQLVLHFADTALF